MALRMEIGDIGHMILESQKLPVYVIIYKPFVSSIIHTMKVRYLINLSGIRPNPDIAGRFKYRRDKEVSNRQKNRGKDVGHPFLRVANP